jgi:hypothetical protein
VVDTEKAVKARIAVRERIQGSISVESSGLSSRSCCYEGGFPRLLK